MLVGEGDISEPATADRIIGDALGRFGHIDTLGNNAGVFVSEPFTDYTAEEITYSCFNQTLSTLEIAG